MKKIIVVLFIVAVIIGGAYAVSRFVGGNRVKSQGTTVAENEYITHTSKEFSFEYPKGWFVYDYSDNEPFPIVQLTNYDINAFVESPYAEGKYFKLEIVKLPNDKNLSLMQWITEYITSEDSQPVIEKTKSFSVESIEAVWQDELVQGIHHPVIYLLKNNSAYLFNLGSEIPEFSKELDHVLGSFHFVKT